MNFLLKRGLSGSVSDLFLDLILGVPRGSCDALGFPSMRLGNSHDDSNSMGIQVLSYYHDVVILAILKTTENPCDSVRH